MIHFPLWTLHRLLCYYESFIRPLPVYFPESPSVLYNQFVLCLCFCERSVCDVEDSPPQRCSKYLPSSIICLRRQSEVRRARHRQTVHLCYLIYVSMQVSDSQGRGAESLKHAHTPDNSGSSVPWCWFAARSFLRNQITVRSVTFCTQ